MKSFKFLSIVFTFILSFDIIIGIGCRYYVKNHTLGGRYSSIDYLLKRTNEDIVIIGNSVTMNSLIPSIITDKLGLSCYNGSVSGMGITFFSTMVDCVLSHHHPKYIIIGLRPEEMGTNIGDGYYDILRPYYHLGYKDIDLYMNKNWQEKILLHSSLYRFNKIWIRILFYCFTNTDKSTILNKGFVANKVPNPLPELKQVEGNDRLSNTKVYYLNKIIKRCKCNKIKLLVVFPPSYIKFNNKEIPCISKVKNICLKNHIKVIDKHSDPFFLSHPNLFLDNVHLNKNGAKIFTRELTSDFK